MFCNLGEYKMARKNENNVVEVVENCLSLPKKKYAIFNSSTVQGGKSLIAHYIINGYFKAHGQLPAIIDLDTKHRAMADTYADAHSLDIQDVETLFDVIAQAEENLVIVDCPAGSTPLILNAEGTKKKGTLKSHLNFFDILENDVEATPIWIALLDNDIVKSMKSLEELDEAISKVAESMPGFKLDVIMVYNKGHWECDDALGGIDGLTSRYITNPPQTLTNFISKPYFNVIFQEINENITSFAEDLKTSNLIDIKGGNIIAKQKIRKAKESSQDFYLSIYNNFLK